ncbi:hypothetical protein [Aquisalibacillus elongatus]|uniref:MotA/TolQ/ExbB proton channel family protein n=1 Tax=Aquisalibacillus elongatus TaxID=485577 RepID=A0A3N5AZC8_9BACI|nr:hypothetical protein [Aquisalibacillus elongatus]RPF50303.1 hypothetical protein EDC24_2738 [Aquisalibacillus elongatus]
MRKDYYDNKNIYYYLESEYKKIKTWSDTGYENVKRSLKSSFSYYDLKIIHRKLNIYYQNRFSFSDLSILNTILSIGLSGLITSIIAFLTIRYGYFYNTANPEDANYITNSLTDIISSVMANIIIATVIGIGISAFILYKLHRKKNRINFYKMILDDCL